MVSIIIPNKIIAKIRINKHYNTKQNNNKSKHKLSKNKHKLNIIINKIISRKANLALIGKL